MCLLCFAVMNVHSDHGVSWRIYQLSQQKKNPPRKKLLENRLAAHHTLISIATPTSVIPYRAEVIKFSLGGHGEIKIALYTTAIHVPGNGHGQRRWAGQIEWILEWKVCECCVGHGNAWLWDNNAIYLAITIRHRLYVGRIIALSMNKKKGSNTPL